MSRLKATDCLVGPRRPAGLTAVGLSCLPSLTIASKIGVNAVPCQRFVGCCQLRHGASRVSRQRTGQTRRCSERAPRAGHRRSAAQCPAARRALLPPMPAACRAIPTGHSFVNQFGRARGLGSICPWVRCMLKTRMFGPYCATLVTSSGNALTCTWRHWQTSSTVHCWTTEKTCSGTSNT